jgi:hypothetical protein
MRHVVDEHVPEGSPGGEAFFDEKVMKGAEEALKKEYESKLGDFKNCVYVVKSGAPDIEIIRYAKKHNIDVIVMGAMGRLNRIAWFTEARWPMSPNTPIATSSRSAIRQSSSPCRAVCTEPNHSHSIQEGAGNAKKSPGR